LPLANCGLLPKIDEISKSDISARFDLITVKADQLSEQHLAEVALAIQNRWNVPAFVKMHEIIVMDDEVEDDTSGKIITAPIDPRDIERGMQVILENLELDQAFRLERDGKAAFKLKLVDRTRIPKWVERSKADMRQPPEGVYACQHCGLWFNNELELSMHTKLHYII
jgi:hypothetical protein